MLGHSDKSSQQNNNERPMPPAHRQKVFKGFGLMCNGKSAFDTCIKTQLMDIQENVVVSLVDIKGDE
jgi:hypothetical protein